MLDLVKSWVRYYTLINLVIGMRGSMALRLNINVVG